MFFIRTEESIEDGQKSLERGRSVRRWAFVGCSPWEHLAFAIPDDEKLEALEAYGYDIDADNFDMDETIHSDLFADCDEEKLARVLNLEPCEDGHGYAEFLPGLCSLEEFGHEPEPSECSRNFQGELFAYLVCFEGEPVGIDPDEGWQLFRPTRIVWTFETGSKVQRQKEI